MPYYQAPGLRVQLTYDDGTKRIRFYHTDALLQKDKYTVFTGGNQPSLQVSSNAAGTERVLVLKDSYANCLLPYLATAFPEMSVLDLRYFRGDLAAYIQEHSITRILLCYNIDFRIPTTFYLPESIKTGHRSKRCVDACETDDWRKQWHRRSLPITKAITGCLTAI